MHIVWFQVQQFVNSKSSKFFHPHNNRSMFFPSKSLYTYRNLKSIKIDLPRGQSEANKPGDATVPVENDQLINAWRATS